VDTLPAAERGLFVHALADAAGDDPRSRWITGA
jgi:hypothetical protein